MGKVPKEVYAFGLVSFLTDISSEMILSVFTLFLAVVLGASAPLIGLLEGLADSCASLLEVVSGYLSDRTRKRKAFVVGGYSLSTAAKCVLALSLTVPGAVFFRLVDRLGKGIRTSPRDAMIASIAKKERGKAFGVQRALDTSGAVLGPLVAYFLLSRFGEVASTFHTIFSWAVIPAVLAVLVLIFMTREHSPAGEKRVSFASEKFKRYLTAYGLFSLAYFSFAFLLLRAYTVGFAVKDVILLYLVANVVLAIMAAPIGALSDKVGRRAVLTAGFLLYAVVCVGFAFVSTKLAAGILFGIYGLFLAVDETVGRAFAADLVPARARGTAMGTLNTVTGLIYLPASLIAGVLWKIAVPVPFLAAAGVAVLACGLLQRV